jgi:hypothetical protein
MVAMVVEPVLPETPSVTTKVRLLPELVGVTLTPVSTPEVKVAEVPEKPPLPLKVTVPVKLVTVWLEASCAVMVMPVMGVPTVCGERWPRWRSDRAGRGRRCCRR